MPVGRWRVILALQSCNATEIRNHLESGGIDVLGPAIGERCHDSDSVCLPMRI
jgi:hypothetical protein